MGTRPTASARFSFAGARGVNGCEGRRAPVNGLRAAGAIALAAAAMLLAAAAAAAADRAFYAIGNSLTADFGPLVVAAFPAEIGQTLVGGEHIRSGQALNYIVANPSDWTSVSPSQFNTALPSVGWTDVSAEPYPGTNSTLATDLSAFQTFISDVQSGPGSGARIYIYAAWPSQTSTATASSFAAYWRQSVPNALTTPTILAGQYMTALYARLTALYGASESIYVIPVGDVLAALDDAIRAGSVPGITNINDIYRDVNHMGQVGIFVAAVTVYSTLYQVNPSGIAIPAAYANNTEGNLRLTAPMAAAIEAIVWSVVSTDPRTGVPAATRSSSGDGPLPLWAVGALGAGLFGAVRRRLKEAAVAQADRC